MPKVFLGKCLKLFYCQKINDIKAVFIKKLSVRILPKKTQTKLPQQQNHRRTEWCLSRGGTVQFLTRKKWIYLNLVCWFWFFSGHVLLTLSGAYDRVLTMLGLIDLYRRKCAVKCFVLSSLAKYPSVNGKIVSYWWFLFSDHSLKNDNPEWFRKVIWMTEASQPCGWKIL